MGKKSKQTTGPSKAALPHINAATSAVTNAVNGNARNLAEVSGGMRGAFDTGLGTWQASQPGLASSLHGAMDVAGGKYLGAGNPYLSKMIGDTAGDVTDRVNSVFGAAGRTGGGAHTGQLASELSSAENDLRYKDYDAERARMMQAMGLIPGLNSAQYDGMGQIVGVGQAAVETPLLGANTLASNINTLWGDAKTSTAKPSTASSIKDGIGTALQIGSAIFSDPRLKTDIVKIGEDPDGLGRYSYRYNWRSEREEGVMADEVATLRPWALGPQIAGFHTVNYGAL